MNKKHRVIILFLFFQIACIPLHSCQGSQFGKDQFIHIPSEDAIMAVKISYPEKLSRKDKIIVWSNDPLKNKFIPDSAKNKRSLWIEPILRKSLLDSGYITIEYIGRHDSVAFLDRKYLASTSDTKAKDLENLLKYIQRMDKLKDKRIILIGYSEGGDINVKATYNNKFNIAGMVQLASCALPAKQNAEYQRERIGNFNFMLSIRSQEFMDKTVNKFSSLDSYHTASMEGVKQFYKENIGPVDSLIYQSEKMDSIYYLIDLYLRNRWGKESTEIKNLHQNNFENYYSIFARNITPQQIVIRTFNPELYYPHIICPVLAVQGTDDVRIDCYPNVAAMEILLNEGKNYKFQKIVLESYKHELVKWNGGGYNIEDNVIRQIINWVDNQ